MLTPPMRFLLFILLPIIAVFSYPPEILSGALPILAIAATAFILLGISVWRGRSVALTLAIFVQGLNIIIRMMMFFSNAKPASGPWDVAYIAASLFGIVLSGFLLFRLDQNDVRAEMVK